MRELRGRLEIGAVGQLDLVDPSPFIVQTSGLPVRSLMNTIVVGASTMNGLTSWLLPALDSVIGGRAGREPS